MQEVWKPIKSYEGCFEVSNLGRVRSITRKIERPDPKKPMNKRLFTYHGKLISFWITKRGYLRLAIAKDGIQRKHLVHRLVADAFIENPFNKEQVNHINGIKSDNRVENLEWVTNYENYAHSVLMGKQKHIKDVSKYVIE